MADVVDAITLNVANALYKGTILVASEASENFAPKGYTLQLSRGIRALKPTLNADGTLNGLIISSARSARGYDYALRQHDVPLRHYSEPPLHQGYIDVGTGKTRRARYRDGYIKLKDSSPKFATEYLVKAFNERKEQLTRLLTQAVRDA
jgi:hypothetical protein